MANEPSWEHGGPTAGSTTVSGGGGGVMGRRTPSNRARYEQKKKKIGARGREEQENDTPRSTGWGGGGGGRKTGGTGPTRPCRPATAAPPSRGGTRCRPRARPHPAVQWQVVPPQNPHAVSVPGRGAGPAPPRRRRTVGGGHRGARRVACTWPCAGVVCGERGVARGASTALVPERRQSEGGPGTAARGRPKSHSGQNKSKPLAPGCKPRACSGRRIKPYPKFTLQRWELE